MGGHHLAIVHIHDLGADLATGGGHWGTGNRGCYQKETGSGETEWGDQGVDGT